MMRLIFWIAVIAYSCVSSSSFSSSEVPRVNSTTRVETTAEEVIDQYVQAIGGMDAVKAIASKRMTYWVHMFGRDAYLMERSWNRPNTMRTGPPGASTYTLTEGEKSWRVTPEGRRELPAAVALSMSRQADIDGPLVDHAEKGVKLTYSGLVRYDLTDLHQVTVTFADGVQWELFFDSRSGLLRKMIKPSYMMLNGQLSRGPDAHFYYYDYRSVGSVLYPHFWIQSVEDHMHLFVVDSIQINE